MIQAKAGPYINYIMGIYIELVYLHLCFYLQEIITAAMKILAIIWGAILSYWARYRGKIGTWTVIVTSVGAAIGIGNGISESARTLTTGKLMGKSAAGGAVVGAIIGPIFAGVVGGGGKAFVASAVSCMMGMASGAGASALTRFGVAVWLHWGQQ